MLHRPLVPCGVAGQLVDKRQATTAVSRITYARGELEKSHEIGGDPPVVHTPFTDRVSKRGILIIIILYDVNEFCHFI